MERGLGATVSLECFTSYVNTKAFDVIGNGAYKTFLVKCRDNNDEWATQAHKYNTLVVDFVRSINGLINDIRRLDAAGIAVISKEIVTNTTPPSYSRECFNVCQISGQHSASCVEIQRSQHKNSVTIYIHSKYITFLNVMWFVCKIDHVIRNYTRQWMWSNEEKLQNMSLSETCNLFTENTETVKSLYHVFINGGRMVHMSFSKHLSIVLNDPPLVIQCNNCPSKDNEKTNKKKKKKKKKTIQVPQGRVYEQTSECTWPGGRFESASG